MGRVDLDVVQRIVKPIALVPGFDGTGVRVLMDAFRDLQPLLGDLAAELRAAREVVERSRDLFRFGELDTGPWPEDEAHDVPTVRLARAIQAYDRHVQHLDDPGSERDGE